MTYRGDIREDAVLHFGFNTRTAAGAPITLAGTPTLEVHKDDDLTQETAGLTLTVDFDSRTGRHHVKVDTSDAFYLPGYDYTVALAAGTVDGVSAVGTVVGEFSIENRGGIPSMVWDEILSGSQHNISTSAGRRMRAMQEYEGYSNGYIYIDTVSGVAGTEPFENGTINNPVSNLADALVLSGVLNINRFFSMPGSAIVLTQDMPYFVLDGKGWALDMAGYDLSSTYVSEAFVTGASTSDVLNAFFDKCLMFMTTTGSAVMTQCGLHTSLTLAESGSYTLVWCYQAAGTAGPTIFDFAASGAKIQVDNWSGEMELQNMAPLNTCGVYGMGALGINANCLGGAVKTAGSLKITDSSSGAVSVEGAANIHTIAEVADGIKNTVVESQGNITLQQGMSLFISALAGVTMNDGKTLLDPSGTEARIVVEIVGRNRTLVTLNPST